MSKFNAVLVQWANGDLVLRKMEGEYEDGMDIEKTMSDNGYDIMNYDNVERIKFMDEVEYEEWSGLIAMQNNQPVASFA